MSQLGIIYDAFKVDNFEPKRQAMAFKPQEDLSIVLHPEVPECLWWMQYQKRVCSDKVANPYWNIMFGRWYLA